jgi:ankyrin repeat protein
LITAGLNGTKEMIQVLIRHKANVNAIDNKNKSALMLATINDNAHSVQALLDAQADLSIKNKVDSVWWSCQINQ